jgi:hypothetical protein
MMHGVATQEGMQLNASSALQLRCSSGPVLSPHHPLLYCFFSTLKISLRTVAAPVLLKSTVLH